MAKTLNKVQLIGNLGKDPESRALQHGSVCNLSIATTMTFKEKESGEMKERVEWHRVVFFNRLAEIAGEYLKKGSKVYVEGSLRTRKWQDNQGNERYITEIIASDLIMLGNESNNSGQQSIPFESKPKAFKGSSQTNQQSSNTSASTGAYDDIPF